MGPRRFWRQEGIAARVVSMPSWELFEAQSQAYRDEVLPPEVTARVAVEAAVSLGWDRYVGSQGKVVGMTGFGASGPTRCWPKSLASRPEVGGPGQGVGASSPEVLCGN